MFKTINRARFMLALLLLLSFNSIAQTDQSCWALQLDGTDPGFHNGYINKAAKLSDGFVIAGTTLEHIFPSKDGNTVGRTNFGGAYICKYDFKGNLIWIDYAIDSFYRDGTTISSLTTDELDNIYICGAIPAKANFYYNHLLSYIHISTNEATPANWGLGNFVAKMDKHGNVLWHMQTNAEPTHLAYDNNRKIVMAANLSHEKTYYNKGNDSIKYDVTLSKDDKILFWIDCNDGTLNQRSVISGRSGNDCFISGLSTDKYGNTYVIGIYESKIKFLSNSGMDSIVISPAIKPISGSNPYMVKYDIAAKPVWKIHAEKSFEPDALHVSNEGAAYMLLSTQYIPSTPTIPFYLNDNTTVNIIYGPNRLLKFTNNGAFAWQAGGGMGDSHGLTINDTSVVVAGHSIQRVDGKDTIKGADGSWFYMPNVSPQIVFAHFDTSGKIKNATRVGISNGPNRYERIGLINGDGRSIILYSDGHRYNGVDSTIFYNDTVKFNNYDGFLIKNTPGICDSVNMPAAPARISLAMELDTLYCIGQDITLYDSVSGSFNVNNDFAVIVRDWNGWEKAIGWAIGTTVDSMLCTIPSNLLPGIYTLRLTASSPAYERSYSPFRVYKSESTVTIKATPDFITVYGKPTWFKSTVLKPGPSVLYQWYNNDIAILGATADTFVSTTLKNHDAITLKIRSLPCMDEVISNEWIVGVTNSIAGPDADKAVQVYPNPNNGVFSLVMTTHSNIAELMVRNTIGKCIFKRTYAIENGQLDTEVKLDDVPAGIYILTLKTSTEQNVLKITVQ